MYGSGSGPLRRVRPSLIVPTRTYRFPFTITLWIGDLDFIGRQRLFKVGDLEADVETDGQTVHLTVGDFALDLTTPKTFVALVADKTKTKLYIDGEVVGESNKVYSKPFNTLERGTNLLYYDLALTHLEIVTRHRMG